MEKHRKDRIYQRVQSEFGANVFTRSYYCSGLSLENLKSKLKVKHGQECRIFVRFDHIVVKDSESQSIIAENALTFFIKVKLIVLFIFIDSQSVIGKF